MQPNLTLSIAESLGATPGFLPHVVELLADLDQLGASASDVLALLKPLPVDWSAARALDLGSGKGACAIALARELGATVLGIDGFAPFVESARAAASEAGLEHRCEFRCEDLRSAAAREQEYDLVLFLSVGPVLGPLPTQMAALRRTVRPGGHILLDDCVRIDDRPLPLPEYDCLPLYADALAAITAHGDRLLHERRYTGQESEALNAEDLRRIRARAAALAAARPDLAAEIDAYVARQEVECAILDGGVANVMWLIQRA